MFLLLNWFSNEKSDLLVVLEEELKDVSIAVARKMTIDYIEYSRCKHTGELLSKDFFRKPLQPTVYPVSSKYFTFEKTTRTNASFITP